MERLPETFAGLTMPVAVVAVDIQTTTAPVIAVDVTPSPDREIDFGEDENMFERLVNGWRKGQLALVVEVLVKVTEVTQAFGTRVRLALHPPSRRGAASTSTLRSPPVPADPA